MLYYGEFYCTFVGDHSADFSEFYGFYPKDCNIDIGWEYSKVLSYNPDGSPASIEAADGTELVFYEEEAFYQNGYGSDI